MPEETVPYQIGIKYCGGCNPRIDRAELVRAIEKLLPQDCILGTERPSHPWDLAILVCGCPVACANRPAIRSLARRWVVVGGETVDLESVPREQMAAAIIRMIRVWKPVME